MRNPRVWIGLAVSLVCLYIAFRDFNPADLTAALVQARYVWLIPAMLVIAVSQVVRAYRWGQLFYPDPAPPLGRLFSALSVGYLTSTVFPARLGDVVRAVLIGGREGQRIAQSFSTVIVERALDVLSIIVMLVAMLPFVSLPPLLAQSAITIGVLFVALFTALWLAEWQRERALALAHWLFSRVPRLDAEQWTRRVSGLIDGLKIMRAPLPLARVTLLSLAIWALGGAFFMYLVMRAFGLQNQVVPPGSALLVAAFAQVVVALAATAPSSPGYVGVYHVAAVTALEAFGVPHADALAFALVSHAANFGLIIVIGVIFLWREGLSFGQLTHPQVEG